MTITHEKNCDNCKWYSWYYDWCKKFGVEMDARSVHDCFEELERKEEDAIPVEWIQNILAEIGDDSPFRPAIEWLLLTYKMERKEE